MPHSINPRIAKAYDPGILRQLGPTIRRLPVLKHALENQPIYTVTGTRPFRRLPALANKATNLLPEIVAGKWPKFCAAGFDISDFIPHDETNQGVESHWHNIERKIDQCLQAIIVGYAVAEDDSGKLPTDFIFLNALNAMKNGGFRDAPAVYWHFPSRAHYEVDLALFIFSFLADDLEQHFTRSTEKLFKDHARFKKPFSRIKPLFLRSVLTEFVILLARVRAAEIFIRHKYLEERILSPAEIAANNGVTDVTPVKRDEVFKRTVARETADNLDYLKRPENKNRYYEPWLAAQLLIVGNPNDIDLGPATFYEAFNKLLDERTNTLMTLRLGGLGLLQAYLHDQFDIEALAQIRAMQRDLPKILVNPATYDIPVT